MRTFTIAVCAIGLAVPAALAQEQFERHIVVQKSGGGAPGGVITGKIMGDTGVFMAHEMGPDKVVKGAPYSAESVTEFKQVLGDGNVIERKQTGASYRDSEGRTRTEAALLGPMLQAGDDTQLITIWDPVAGVRYVVNTAEKSVMKIEVSESGEGRAPGIRMPAPMPAPAGAVGVGAVMRHRANRENAREENLGTRNFDGVAAEGTRWTVTIPAGEIGNARPIQVVNERWFSAQLQTVVMTRHSDPRTGDHTFQLRNIRLAEPARSLFEPPPGYEVREGLIRMERKIRERE